jgi:pyruvate ferredoxin oxidoreductase gamma subunit
MKQVRIHGRGGQGVVTAAELLAVAAFRQGKQAQAFPSFGSERMGAPVVAFCRIDDREIRSREPVAEPDALIIQDPTLLHQIDVFSGIASTGFVLINTTRTPESLSIDPILKRLPGGHVRTVPATELARQHIGRPLPNAAMLGALARLTGWISIDALCEALDERFPPAVAEKNKLAARAAFASESLGDAPSIASDALVGAGAAPRGVMK